MTPHPTPDSPTPRRATPHPLPGQPGGRELPRRPQTRAELVERLRRELAAGTYRPSPEAVADELVAVLRKRQGLVQLAARPGLPR